nr:MAG TPA: Head fiber protein [Caudoviricetes sp.]
MAVDMTKLTDGNGLLYGLKGLKAQIVALLGNKVEKVSGKGLSTNDYTAADKKKLDGIASGANNYTLPTAGSTLGGVKTTSTVTSASGYTPAPIIDGVPYYKDTNTTYNAATQSSNGLMTAADKKKLDAFGAAGTYATQTYVGQQIAAAGHITKTIVTALPEPSAAKDNVIYMIKKTSGSGSNLYDEYMLIDGRLEIVGDSATKIDTLSNADVEEILGQI